MEIPRLVLEIMTREAWVEASYLMNQCEGDEAVVVVVVEEETVS
jgi:hypothetical protein